MREEGKSQEEGRVSLAAASGRHFRIRLCHSSHVVALAAWACKAHGT